MATAGGILDKDDLRSVSGKARVDAQEAGAMKKCTKCCETKPLDAFYRRGKHLQRTCKACHKAAQPPQTHKACTKCGETKPLDAFGRCGEYLKRTCKVCRNAITYQCWERNREKYRDRKRENYWANVEEMRRQDRAYNEKTRERRREVARQRTERASDGRVRSMLAAQYGLRAKDIPPSFVEAKRIHLKLTRLIKEKTK